MQSPYIILLTLEGGATHNLVISACPVPTYLDCTIERENIKHYLPQNKEHVLSDQ